MNRTEEIKEIGHDLADAIRDINFFVGGNQKALAKMPYQVFAEHSIDPNKEWNQGQVTRVGHEKYLLENWGRINTVPSKSPICRLFRDKRLYDWMPKEFCLRGFRRYYKDAGNPQNTGNYIVIQDDAGENNTPPPGVPSVWDKES